MIEKTAYLLTEFTNLAAAGRFLRLPSKERRQVKNTPYSEGYKAFFSVIPAFAGRQVEKFYSKSNTPSSNINSITVWEDDFLIM